MFEGRLFFHQIGYNDRHYIFQVTTNFLFHPQIIFLFPSLLSLSNEYSINLNRSVTIKLASRINPPLSFYLPLFLPFFLVYENVFSASFQWTHASIQINQVSFRWNVSGRIGEAFEKKKKISSESCVIFIPRLNTGKKKIEIESKRAEFCYWLLFLRKIYIFLYDLCCYVGERERRILLFVIRSDQR